MQAGSDKAPAESPAAGVRDRWVAVAAFALIAAAYLGTVSPVWFVHPDSAKYLGLARSLGRGAGYTFNHMPHGKYVPVFPLLLAPVWAVMGRNFVAMQAVVALAGLGALAATYALVRAREGARAAFWILLLTATCGWFWTASSLRLLAEAPYACFSLLALWYAEKQTRAETFSAARWLLAGVLGAVAIYTHMVGIALIPALAAGAFLARAKDRPARQRLVAAALVAVVTAGAAGYWLYRGSKLPHLASYTHHVHLADDRPVTYQFYKMGLRLKEWPATALSLRESQFVWQAGLALFAVLLVPGLVQGFVRHRSCSEFYLVCFFLVSAVGGGESGLERYATPVVPLILYFGYLSLTVVGRWAAWLVLAAGLNAQAAAKAPRVLLAVATLFVLCNATYNRVKRSRGASKFDAERQEDARKELADWEALAQYVADEVPADAKIYPASGGVWDIFHFLSERTLFNLSRAHRGELPVFQSLVAWGADYMVYDHRFRSEQRFQDILAKYPACFQEVFRNEDDLTRLYRLDPAKVREVLAVLQAQAEAASDGARD